MFSVFERYVLVLQLDAFFVLSDEPRQNQRRKLVDRKLKPPVILLLAVPRHIFCFGSFRCGVWLFIDLLVRY